MVKAAYSSGKPAVGVGAGNTPVIIDETADIRMAVSSVIHSKTFDNGMICASEQSVTVVGSAYDAVKKEFQCRGCYFLKPEELDKVRHTILINGSLNAKIVGQSACKIAKMTGVEVPESTQILTMPLPKRSSSWRMAAMGIHLPSTSIRRRRKELQNMRRL